MPRTILAALSLLPMVFACSEIDASEIVAFERMEVQELSWKAIDSDFVFQVANPTLMDLGVARFDYTLELSGSDLFWGDDQDGMVVEAGGSELAFPVGLTFAEIFESARANQGEDTLPFVFAGTVGFDTDLGPIDLPFQAEGDFPALRTPEVKLAALKVQDVDWTEATVGIGLDVSNEHGSTLTFADLAYGLRIEGYDVADGQVASLGSAQAGTTRLDLPVTIDFLETGSAAAAALMAGGKVDVGLSGATNVQTPFGVLPLEFDAVEGLSLGN